MDSTAAKTLNKTDTSSPSNPKVQQPTPQALPSRSGPSSVLVSPRQKGNPVLNFIRALPWEYSDIPSDYVLGATTCALFLSLKYHRLHPEYIYSRIRALAGKYNLRIVLTMVDIQNHEDPLKELSKTSLINNVTIILCWSAQEAGRYLELFKTFEHAAPTSIRAHQSSGYSEKLVDFICAPRSINKTDAMGLVSNFGSIRSAVNARPEEIGLIAGWGHKKVQRWCNSVHESFRVQRTAKRKLNHEESTMSIAESEQLKRQERDVITTARPSRSEISSAIMGRSRSNSAETPDPAKTSDRDNKRAGLPNWQPDQDEEEAAREVSISEERLPEPRGSTSGLPSKNIAEVQPSEGIVAALAKLREQK